MEAGDSVDVLDGEASWTAKILETRSDSALVHFLKFNARHDEWIPLERLRVRRESLPLRPPESSKDFKVGERVMASWKYGRKYPGRILEERENGAYRVKFDDGVTVSVKSSSMRYPRKDELLQEGEEGAEEGSDESTRSGRRERKSKFNVKDLLSGRRNKRSRSNKEEEEPPPQQHILKEEDTGSPGDVPPPDTPALEEGLPKRRTTSQQQQQLLPSSAPPPKKKTKEKKRKTNPSNNKKEEKRTGHKSNNINNNNGEGKKTSDSEKENTSSAAKKSDPSGASTPSTNTTTTKGTSSSSSTKKSDPNASSTPSTNTTTKGGTPSSKKSDPSTSSTPKGGTASSKKSDFSGLSSTNKGTSSSTKKNDSSTSSTTPTTTKGNSSTKKNDSSTSSTTPTTTKRNSSTKKSVPSASSTTPTTTKGTSFSKKGDPSAAAAASTPQSTTKNTSSSDKKSDPSLLLSGVTVTSSSTTFLEVEDDTHNRKDKEKVDNLVSSVSSPLETSEGHHKSEVKKGSVKVSNGLKPRITEPLLKDGPPLTLVTGKRERKRKKFWDEEEEQASSSSGAGPPPAKASKRTLSSSSSEVPSSRRVSLPKEPKPKSSKSSRFPEVPTNGTRLEYLLFDMSQEPDLIAKQMVEGFNIPGPGEPIPVDSSSLPQGWQKRVIQRGLGVTRGKWDVFIQNSAGKLFRSKTELQKYFDDNNLSISVDSFDFSLDDKLKRLRQIWKQYVILPNLKPGEKLSSPNRYNRKGSKKGDSLGGVGTPSPLASLTNTAHHPSLPTIRPKENGEPSLLHPSSPSPPSSLPSPSPSSERGLRCKINECGKLFRNDKLLLMHVKHYHPEFRDPEDSPPEKKLKTLLPEVQSVPDKKKPSTLESSSRKRNDSSYSLGSSSNPAAELLERTLTPPPFSCSSSSSSLAKFKARKKGKQFSEIESIVGEDSSAEMDGGGGGDHLTSEEVVNCTCKRLEEDGLMIQCDSCLCWQHGACISIFEEEQVPEKHVCSVCRNPPGSRHPSSRMLIDQDFLKEGKLIYLPGPKKMSSSSSLVSREEAFRKLSDLMSDLLSLNRVLHSLRIKISVASQKNSSKVFMWSSPWISPHTPSRKGGEDDPMVAAAATPSQEVLTTPLTPHHESLLLNDLNNAEGGEDLIDPSMIPSVSEVEELLPSIIQGLPTEEFEEEQPVPLPNIIPEPKRIDKDESRCNLIQHIDDVQCELEERLNLLEENLCILEKNEEEDSEQILYDAVHADCAKTKAVIQMLLLDLSTGKTLLGTL